MLVLWRISEAIAPALMMACRREPRTSGQRYSFTVDTFGMNVQHYFSIMHSSLCGACVGLYQVGTGRCTHGCSDTVCSCGDLLPLHAGHYRPDARPMMSIDIYPAPQSWTTRVSATLITTCAHLYSTPSPSGEELCLSSVQACLAAVGRRPLHFGAKIRSRH